MSLMLFFVVFISFSIFFLSRGEKMPFYKQSLNYFAGALMLITVFGAVMLIVIMYMILFFSLKLTGISGIVTGLIPSIALSAVSLYIKKRLQIEEAWVRSTSSPDSEEYEVIDEMTVNGGGSVKWIVMTPGMKNRECSFLDCSQHFNNPPPPPNILLYIFCELMST